MQDDGHQHQTAAAATRDAVLPQVGQGKERKRSRQVADEERRERAGVGDAAPLEIQDRLDHDGGYYARRRDAADPPGNRCER